MRVGPSTPMEPAGSPSISYGATTSEQPDSVSSPVSVPMATLSPRSITSFTRATTTNCRSRTSSTRRTRATSPNASATWAVPPTHALSAWPERSDSTFVTVRSTASTDGSPVIGALGTAFRRRPMRAPERWAAATARVASVGSAASPANSSVCFSTVPLAITITSRARPGVRPTTWADRTSWWSRSGARTTAALPVSSASRLLVSASICSISRCDRLKKALTCSRSAVSNMVGPSRWSTKKR